MSLHGTFSPCEAKYRMVCYSGQIETTLGTHRTAPVLGDLLDQPR
jgi:hypothetical protein